jgi:FAD:protein FMN transferase
MSSFLIRKKIMKTMKRSIYLIILIFSFLSIIFLLNQFNKNKQYKETRLALGTIAEITIVCEKKEQAGELFNKCFSEIKRIEDKFSVFNKNSEVYKFNNRNQDTIEISPELFYIIKESIKISKQTYGAFDITIMPLIDLWKKAAKQDVLPNTEQINQVLEYIGYKKIVFLSEISTQAEISEQEKEFVIPAQAGIHESEISRNNTIQLPKNMQIDLGGIAKGYVIDRIAKILYNTNIEKFLINIGGDIFCFDSTKKGWEIGLQNPFDENKIFDIFNIKNKAVVTSGDYNRYFEINNKRFSHIIDSRTGLPVKKSLSISIFADTAMYADAIATAISVMNTNERKNFFHKNKKLDYVLILGEKKKFIIKKSFN